MRQTKTSMCLKYCLFKDELLAVAMEPSRYMDWCLTADENQRDLWRCRNKVMELSYFNTDKTLITFIFICYSIKFT